MMKTQLILDFLRKHFDKNVANLLPNVSGERSKTYIFNVKSSKFILRTNNEKVGFKKDRYAYEQFSSHVPIPKIFKIGKLENKYYAISEFCAGQVLKDFDKTLSLTLIKNIITTLDVIHSMTIPNNGAYGIIDAHDRAQFKSWKDWLLKDYVLVSKEDGSYYTWKNVSIICRNKRAYSLYSK